MPTDVFDMYVLVTVCEIINEMRSSSRNASLNPVPSVLVDLTFA